MNIQSSEARFIDADGTYTTVELLAMTGLQESELHALIECGAIDVADATGPQWHLSAWSITVARQARELRDAFDLNDAHSVAVVTRFAQRVKALERELRALRSKTGEI